MSGSRDFDVILYGASGFTGRQTVEYFRRHAPPGLRWAIAGRNRAKLEALQADVPILTADSTDPRQARMLTGRSRVLLSTAGPFALYSDELVTACVATRTHYTDITGETLWVRSLIDRHHARAAAEGTRIVPFCGFDSIPSDLGVFLLAQHLGPTLARVRAFFHVRGGRPNGGTTASAHYTYSSGADRTGHDLFLLAPAARRPLRAMEADPTRATFDPLLGAWAAPLPQKHHRHPRRAEPPLRLFSATISTVNNDPETNVYSRKATGLSDDMVLEAALVVSPKLHKKP